MENKRTVNLATVVQDKLLWKISLCNSILNGTAIWTVNHKIPNAADLLNIGYLRAFPRWWNMPTINFVCWVLFHHYSNLATWSCSFWNSFCFPLLNESWTRITMCNLCLAPCLIEFDTLTLKYSNFLNSWIVCLWIPYIILFCNSFLFSFPGIPFNFSNVFIHCI